MTGTDNAQLAARIAALEAEIAHFTQSGIVEVSVRNPSVAEYMVHWEQRAEFAEAEVARLLSRVADLEGQVSRVNDNGNKISTEKDCLRSALLRLGTNGGYSRKYLDMVIAGCASGKFPMTLEADQ